MELKELNLLCKHMKNVRSRQPCISMNFCTESSSSMWVSLNMIKAVFGTSPSVLYQITTHMIHVLSVRFKRQWSITFMNYYQKSKSCFIFLMDVGYSMKITKNFMNLSPQIGLWFRCRMDFLCHQSQQVTLWLDWWLRKMPCCKKKFAKTNEQSD